MAHNLSTVTTGKRWPQCGISPTTAENDYEYYSRLSTGCMVRQAPWEPFKSPLTAHDIEVIAQFRGGEIARAAKAKADSLDKLRDYNKRMKAAKTWGKRPKGSTRWNATTNKWEK